jgi:hypothetical protein
MKAKKQSRKVEKITHVGLFRAIVSCKLAREALDGKTKMDDEDRVRYAMFNMSHAIEEIARAMMEDKAKGDA